MREGRRNGEGERRTEGRRIREGRRGGGECSGREQNRECRKVRIGDKIDARVHI